MNYIQAFSHLRTGMKISRGGKVYVRDRTLGLCEEHSDGKREVLAEADIADLCNAEDIELLTEGGSAEDLSDNGGDRTASRP